MIKQFNGFKEEATTTTQQLPVGNYVVIIKAIKYIQGAGGASDRLDLAIDVAEGEQEGFFQNQFNASTDEDKKWKGKASLWIPGEDNTESDKRAIRNFNAFAAYLANANPNYHWDWDETKLKGKKIGAAFRKEYNIINGREVSYTAFAWFCDADDVRSGKAKPAKEKYRNGATGNQSSGATPILNEGFVSVPDDAPEEGIPF